MVNIFKIQYNDLATTLLPTFLRKGHILSLAKALVAPLVTLYNNFILGRDNNLYSLGVTGQVCSLRRMLNKEIDKEKSRIRIEGSEQIAYSLRVPNEDIVPAKFLEVNNDDYLKAWNPKNILAGSNRFFVYLPFEIYKDTNIIRQATSLLEKYKLVSKYPLLMPEFPNKKAE